MVAVAEHPLLLADVFECVFPDTLDRLPTPEPVLDWLRREPSPVPGVPDKVRALLRSGGFKPSGRSKPASEYLVKAHGSGHLGSINLAVDVCNAVSLHSGFPISVVDADLAQPPYRIEVVAEKQAYVFNPSGQELDLAGLLCLWDREGPCGSPVKDSQRTKTHPGTRRTLSVIWGEQSLSEQVKAAGTWYRQLLRECGAQIA